MPEVAKTNTLKITKTLDFGVYLDGAELGEILLPKRYVPKGAKEGDEVEVFLYYDSEDRLIATTEKPLAQAGEFVLLQAVDITPNGAFLNWGLPKDLFVPFREQQPAMEEGKYYVVYVFTDGENGRPLASARVDRFLNKEELPFEQGQEVDVLVVRNTELGYKCVVNNTNSGILYHNEVFQPLQAGLRLKAYVSSVREDGRLDLILHKPGYEKVTDLGSQILETLRKNKGFLPLSDKSPAEEIYAQFSVSKKTYKKAIGALFRERKILIEENGIRLAVK